MLKLKTKKCDNGHIYNESIYNDCPECEYGKYEWDSTMRAQDIVSFTISSGVCPIRHIEFRGNELVYSNKINGSRDALVNFPDDFFDEKVISLSVSQTLMIISTLLVTDFSVWKTDKDLIKKQMSLLPGFCVTEHFECQFLDGREFKYIGKSRMARSFNELFSLLYKMCDAKENIFDSTFETESEEDKEKVYKVICPKCHANNTPKVHYCGFCGEDLTTYHGNLEESTEECDLQQTLGLCHSCGAGIPFCNKYCDICGEKVFWKFH